jgi:general secretion pathway protein D
MSGLPWRSQIPGLKYLFGQGQKSKTDTETVFALMPHVVRRLDLDDLNIKPISIGTQNVVELRHLARAPEAVAPAVGVPSGTPTSAPPATVPAPSQTPPATQPGAMNAEPGVTGAVKNDATLPIRGGPVLSLDPPMVNQPTGGMFALNVILNGGQNVFSVPVEINYDPKVMRLLNVSNAGALSKDGAAVALVNRDDAEKGLVRISVMRPPGSGGVTPSGPLFTLSFVAKAAGQGTVSVGKAVLLDPNNTPIDANGSQAIINVR